MKAQNLLCTSSIYFCLYSANYSFIQRKCIFSLQDADYLMGVMLGNEKQMNFCILFMSLDMFQCLLVYNLRELE